MTISSHTSALGHRRSLASPGSCHRHHNPPIPTTTAREALYTQTVVSDTESQDVEKRTGDIVPAGWKPSRTKWILMLCGIFSGGLLFGLDTTIAADVQGSVLETFGQIEKLPWVGVGFPMGSVAVILLVGQLFGTFQIKWLMLGSFTLFEVGSAVCGAAPSLDALIVGRVIAGMGGAGMYLGALNYIAVFITPRERPLYNAVIGLCWGIGAILGPVIGGAFSVNQQTTWRWAFYINLPLAGAQAPLFLFIFPRYNPMPNGTAFSKFKHIDWVGALLNACTFVFLIVGLTFSGSTWSWGSAGPVAFWVIFGVSITLYSLQQTFAVFTTVDRRLFPVHFLKSRTLVITYLSTAVAGAAAGITIYYIPLLFQFTHGDSAIQAAVRLLPMIITYVAFMMISGALLPVLRRYAAFYAVGGAFLTAAGAAMFTISAATRPAAIYGFEFLTAVGAGLTFQTGYAVASSTVSSQKDLPRAIGFINVAQIGSTAVALALAGCIYQNVGLTNVRNALGSLAVPDEVLRGALAGAQSSAAMPQEVRHRIVEAIVHTIADDFGLIMAGGALMLMCSFFLKWEKLQLVDSPAGL